MSRVIPKTEEANTVPRRSYPRMVRPGRRALATSMAHYQREPHCRGKASGRRLVLTCLKG